MSHLSPEVSIGAINGVTSDRQVLVDRLDTRSLVLATLVLTGTALCLSRIDLLIAMVLLNAMGVILLTRVPLLRAFRQVLAMDMFILFMLVLVPFQIPGDTAFTLLGFHASWPGLIRAAELALKTNAVILVMVALITGINPARLGHALHQLRCPAKLVALFLFTARYLELLKKRHGALNNALKSRGFHVRCNLHSWRTQAWLYGNLLIRSIDQAERMLEAMRCRGFHGQWHVLTTTRIAALDISFLTSVTVICAMILGIQWL